MNCRKRYLLTVLLFYPSLYSETFTYQNVTGSETTSTIYTIDQVKDGKKARAEWHEGKSQPFSEVVMTDSFSTRQWKYFDSQTNTEIYAWISNDTVFINGTFKKKEIHRICLQNGIVWKQLFPFDLKNFVLSCNPTYVFCGIGLFGPATMKFGTMKAKRIGIEHQTINGKDLELVHLRVSLPGILSKFWHGDYWYTKDNGTLIKSVSVDKPFSSPTITVLGGL